MTAPRPRHFSMLRSFAPADLLTLGNAACGMGAVLLCLRRLTEGPEDPLFHWAFALPLCALVLDGLDGAVARKTRRSSTLGADLDSLADIVSFGVAPATLAWTLGLRGGWDALALIYFVCCGISRLARFNVTAAALADESGKVRYFEGTPIPTSVALVLALAVAYAQGRTGDTIWWGALSLGPWTLHPLSALFVLSGSAMISATLRVPKP
jgi:CDP-diacylglycerol--serine O-phosphatidyltransferase